MERFKSRQTVHPLLNEDDIRTGLNAIIGDGQVTEIRILDAFTADVRRAQTWSGYFDEPDKAARAVASTGFTRWAGAYFTPNPVNPKLLGRAVNKLKPAGRGAATANHDIVDRKWLLVDCDPCRPAGIASSDEEHEWARQRMNDVDEFLYYRGFPTPVFADSGNGYHLLYRVDWPTNDGGLTERALKILAHFADDAKVKIDVTVHNPARIWRLYGTRNCKGDADGAKLDPPRPQRMAKILSFPTKVACIRSETLGGAALL